MNAVRAPVTGEFSFRALFRRILDDTGLKASTVARELLRERSLMYKWLSGVSVPPSSYVPLIVQIVMKHSSATKRLVLAKNLRAIVRDAELPADLRDALLMAGSFEDTLGECLDLSLTPGLVVPAPRPAQAARPGRWSVLVGALVAALLGGLLWNALNRIFGWNYFMGSTDDALRGWRALVWGLVTTAPIPLPLLLAGPAVERARRVLPGVLFTLAGAGSALLFHASGARAAVEGLSLGYALQETIIVVVFGLVLSIPPQLSALLAWRRRPRLVRWLATLLAPAAAALLGFLVTLLVDRPVSEVLQLRGLAVGFALRFAQFISLSLVLAGKD